MQAEAQATEPTAAEMDAALVFTTDGYSDADGVDHVTAAERAVACIVAHENPILDALEVELLAAEVIWNDLADLTDRVKANREGREVTADDEAIWSAASKRHWAAVDALTSYVPRSPAELVRKATLLTNNGDTRLRSEEHFAALYLADAQAVASFPQWKAVSGHNRDEPSPIICLVQEQADRFSQALAVHSETDGKSGEAEALCDAAWRAMLAAEEAAEGLSPSTPAGVAFQLLCAAGEVDCVENGSTDEIKERAVHFIRAAISNALAVLGLPHDAKTAEFFLGSKRVEGAVS